jgi:hypothetical protein
MCKIAVLTFRALHGMAQSYLSADWHRIADIAPRRRLRSAATSRLDVRPARLKTVGDRAFAVAGPRVWNSLPNDITSCRSFPAERRKQETYLFKSPYPNLT